MVTRAVIAIDSVVPAGPKRKAAQIRAGKITYVTGPLIDIATDASTVTVAISRAPFQVRIRRHASAGREGQTMISGTTKGPPAVSHSHHVRKHFGSLGAVTLTP